MKADKEKKYNIKGLLDVIGVCIEIHIGKIKERQQQHQ